MPAFFTEGFFVREPAWHGMGIVLDDYPSKAEAMKLAGHDYDVLEVPSFTAIPLEICERLGLEPNRPNGLLRKDDGYKSIIHGKTGSTLHKPTQSYEIIQNSTAYEVAELLFDQGFQYETGITLEDGASCAITLKLDEPFYVSGDASQLLPFGCLSWRHDGGGSLKVRTGTIRQVCANTVSASEAEGKRLGTDFTFRHTKNVKARIEDAKAAIKGARAAVDVYREVAEELAAIRVTPEQRDLFVSTIIGASTVNEVTASTRVLNNVERERTKVLSLFMGQTIPEEHALTGYGLWLAGGEYFDHLRNYRTQDSYVTRTLLTDNPAKKNLRKTIAEVVAA